MANRKLIRFSASDYNIQTGIYNGKPFWVVPELKLYISIPTNAYGQMISQYFLSTFQLMEKKRAETIANWPQNKSHPTPIRHYQPAITLGDCEVSVPEAAKIYGVSESTIRRRCEKGELLARRNKNKSGLFTGKWKIKFQTIAEDRLHLKLSKKPASSPVNPISTTPSQSNSSLLRASEAAKLISTSRSTLWRYVRNGKLKAHYPTGSKEGRFYKEDILKLKDNL